MSTLVEIAAEAYFTHLLFVGSEYETRAAAIAAADKILDHSDSYTPHIRKAGLERAEHRLAKTDAYVVHEHPWDGHYVIVHKHEDS